MDYPVKTPRQLRPLLMGFRKAAGLTQAQVAARLGVTQQTYAQLEAKPESASLDRLFHILKILKVSIVLTQAALSVPVEGRTPARARAVKAPAAAKQRPAKKRPAKKSAAKKRATSAPASPASGAARTGAKAAHGRGQRSPKPAAGKPKAPTRAATRKREDW